MTMLNLRDRSTLAGAHLIKGAVLGWTVVFLAVAGCGGSSSSGPRDGGGGTGGARLDGGTGGSGSGGTGGLVGGTGGTVGSGGATVDAPADAPADGPADAGDGPRADAPSDAPTDSGADLGPEAPADGGTDGTTDAATCGADASTGTCTLTGGGTGVCLGGACVAGDCHDTSADCQSGKICGVAMAHVCGACTTDGQCTGDATYGAGTICVGGGCVMGNCHDSSECAGKVCGAATANNCGACKSDSQCQTDPKYGATFICDTTVGQTNSGKCVASTCTTASTACAANAADFCCGGTCVAGNCCTDDDCRTAFGQGFACSTNHTCSQCAAALGNQYVVDPVGGNDSTATGSGKVGTTIMASCAFKTITRALQVIGSSPPVGTTITVLGVAGSTTNLYTVQAAGQSAPESLPIRLPTNIKITTKDGPVRVVLPANASGFLFTAAGASIAPDAAAALTIDGSTQTSGPAIIVQSGTGNAVSIAGVKVQNTGDDGIRVASGTLNVGPGVVVTGAGTTAAAGTRRDGLRITGGIVNITVGSGEAQTSFNSNSSRGIEVGGVGVLNITGVPVITPPIAGDGTVVARFNDQANIYIQQTPGAATAVSTIKGVVAWASVNGQAGIHLFGGSKVKLRNSVSLANGLSGVAVTVPANTVAGNDLSGIDLGTVNDFGHNILQASIGSNPNFAAGICVRPGLTAGAQTLTAMGNVFAGPRDCSQNAPGAIVRAANCVNRVDVGLVQGGNADVTVPVNNCQ
jgi:hypothetical protein